MTMVCSRVDCAERATALLVYDPRSAAAWMRDRDPVADRGQGISFCGVHADRATVPMGWTLTDERSPAFTAPPEAVELIRAGSSAAGSAGGDADDVADPSAPNAADEKNADIAVDAIASEAADGGIAGEVDDGTATDGDTDEDVDVGESPAETAAGETSVETAAGETPVDSADVLTLWADHPADPYHVRGGDGEPALPESPLLARAFRAAHRS